MDFYDILMAAKIGGKGGGGGSTIQVEPLSVTENGTYTAPAGKAYTPVNANVPNTYTQQDAWKVVAPDSSGNLGLQSQSGPQDILDNGLFDTTTVSSVKVQVQAQPNLEFGTASVRGVAPIIETLYYLPTHGFDGFRDFTVYMEVNAPDPPSPTTYSLVTSENGSYYPSQYSAEYFDYVDISVPTYGATNIGEVVVDDGSGNLSLAQQTSETYQNNGTYDTTTISSVTVAISSRDWSEIGYSGEPDFIEALFQYAKLVATNYNDSKNYSSDHLLWIMPYVDTSARTSMESMFLDCPILMYVPLLDTSNVTNMHSMFDHCSALLTIPLFDTNNVTNMNGMFWGCTALNAMPWLNTSNVTDKN